ncbi:glycoside hydrolase family 3 N-terminal domain-containing protein [Tardisphaera miroshnichenkoae]
MPYVWPKAKKELYKEGWIDHNKNGTKDPYEDLSLPVEKRVDDLLSRMTLQEKLRELRSSLKSDSNAGNLSVVLRSLEPRQAAEQANEIQRKAIEETRLGVPVIIHDECLHGCMAKYSTVFPQAIALGATWDPELVGRVASAIANETRRRGIRQCLSPVVNLVWDVRAGRTEETFGEDPTLAASLARAYVEAFSRERVITTPKHFMMNFVGEGGRDSAEIHLSERIIRETELIPFEESFRAGALSVMAAYNSIDGVPCSSNSWLLTDLLRGELGFAGFVVSDYGSVPGIFYKHRAASSPEEAAALALKSGLDVELPEIELYGKPLERALEQGLVSEKDVDTAVRRVLRAKFAIGLFDDPYVNPDDAEAEDAEARELAYKAAADSIVLLKNEGVLPLGELRSLLVIGKVAERENLGGYTGTPKGVKTILDGIKEEAHRMGASFAYEPGCDPDMDADLPIPNRFFTTPDGKERGLLAQVFSGSEGGSSEKPAWSGVTSPWPDGFCRFDWGYGSPFPGISDQYLASFSGFLDVPEEGKYTFRLVSLGGRAVLKIDSKEVVQAGDSTEEGVVSLGAGKHAFSLEYSRIGHAYAYLKLGWERDDEAAVRSAAQAASKADAVVVVVGLQEGEQRDRAKLALSRPQEKLVEEVLKANENAIVVIVGGSAVTGEWLRRAKAVLHAWYPGEEGGSAVAAVLFGKEDPGGRLPFTWPLFEGQLPLYHYQKPSGRVSDYVNMQGTSLFPFGHGLSYASFRYEDAKLEKEGDGWKVKVTVTNSSGRSGKCVVQLYLRYPPTPISTPQIKLKAFKKVTVGANSKVMVELPLSLDDLAIYDAEMRRYVPAGEYELLVGSSAGDLPVSLPLSVEDEIRADVTVERTSEGVIRVENRGPIADLVAMELLIDGVPQVRRVYLGAGTSREISAVDMGVARGLLVSMQAA